MDDRSKLLFVQRRQDSCLVLRDNSGISSKLGGETQTLLDVRRDTKGPFLVATLILGNLSVFSKSQGSSPLEALNSACLSSCQRDLRPPLQMRRGTMALSRGSTGDSDIPSSCEMKEEPSFKPLQLNSAFFPVRASRCPFHLRQQTQGPSHIPIAVGSLLLKCLWKVSFPLQSKLGKQL